MRPWTGSAGATVEVDDSANRLELLPGELTEAELYMLQNPATQPVDPRVHNLLVEALLARLVEARRTLN